MACTKSHAQMAEEYFDCPSCGQELVSRVGVKAIHIIFWVLMGIWMLLALQIELYSGSIMGQSYHNIGTVMWSIRANEFTCFIIAYALYRYWRKEAFFLTVLLAFGVYLLTLCWICQALAGEEFLLRDNFFNESHLILRGIFAYIATVFAWFVSKMKYDIWQNKA